MDDIDPKAQVIGIVLAVVIAVAIIGAFILIAWE